MHILTADSINDSFIQAGHYLLNHGEEVIISGGTNNNRKTLELHPFNLVITDPTARTLMLPHRGNNPFATLYEALWVLCGDNRVKPLRFFLHRAGDWSDDGLYWRAAYGPRLRKWLGIDDNSAQHTHEYNITDRSQWGYCSINPIDQIKYVYETLKKDSTSRQAVMSIYDPAKECTVGTTADFPCTMTVMYLIRNGKLNCSVVMRSNDLWFGFSGINVYEWTVIQEILAKLLNVEVGNYHHYVNSFHIYEDYIPKMKKVLDTYKNCVFHPIPILEFIVDESYDATMAQYETMINKINDLMVLSEPIFLEEIKKINEIILVMMPQFIYLFLYVLYKKLKPNHFWKYYKHCMNELENTDFKVSVHFWILKQFKMIRPGDISKAYLQVLKNEYNDSIDG